MNYREALQTSLREALQKNPKVFLMGEDVGRYGGSYAVSKGLLEEFGEDRVRDTPLSESGFTGMGIGAALGGLRPIVEIMTVNFSLLALDQIVNTAALYRHMSGGQFGVPLVIRIATGAGRQLAAQHSHSFEGWFTHIPGIKILAPATVQDARWMLDFALQEQDPILVFEHVSLFTEKIEGEPTRPTGVWNAEVRRSGRDLTLITYGGMLPMTLLAAAELSKSGIEAEVLDLRSLRPLNTDAILKSISHTHRAVVIDEGWKTLSLSAEISARIMENAFYDLDAPVRRVCSEEVPMPYPKHLEEAALPQVAKIVSAAKDICGKNV